MQTLKVVGTAYTYTRKLPHDTHVFNNVSGNAYASDTCRGKITIELHATGGIKYADVHIDDSSPNSALDAPLIEGSYVHNRATDTYTLDEDGQSWGSSHLMLDRLLNRHGQADTAKKVKECIACTDCERILQLATELGMDSVASKAACDCLKLGTVSGVMRQP